MASVNLRNFIPLTHFPLLLFPQSNSFVNMEYIKLPHICVLFKLIACFFSHSFGKDYAPHFTTEEI